MPVPGLLGSHGIVLAFVLLVFFLIRRQWRNASSKKDEVFRLLAMASHESATAELLASGEYASVPAIYRCAVCLCPTTTRCSRCKVVRYCSSKCQIIHWRQGHKEECRLPAPVTDCAHENDLRATVEPDNLLISQNNDTKLVEIRKHSRARLMVNCHKDLEPTAEAMGGPTDVLENLASSGNASRRTVDKKKHGDNKDFEPHYRNDKTFVTNDFQKLKSGNKKPTRSAPSVGMSPISDLSAITSPLPVADPKFVLPTKVCNTQNLPPNNHNALKSSVRKVVQHFKASRPPLSSSCISENGTTGKPDCQMIFPYGLFVKLYSCDGVELFPFGLVNCGNSCYANAVLQCLMFTRPLTSYLVKGIHSKACQKKGWCFICEFECLVSEARKGKTPVSPIRILSKIQKIGKHLGPGREEDAHEFLRYAVDTMQSVCLKEINAAEPFAEETTLIGLTFGGSLHSKIKCMNCFSKSEQLERMMDLTVEIDGNIESLEDALTQFTASEILDGQNQYRCGRCRSYQKAKKKLMVSEAPNVLTIVLKRFQSGNFGKLSKPIQFPEILNMAPYMSGTTDISPVYSLYGVVVHLDVSNAPYSGHYVCYIKNLCGEWFRINDSMVTPVAVESVLLDEAYMLLYSRYSPRAPNSVRKNMESRSEAPKERTLKAVSSRTNRNVLHADPYSSKHRHGSSASKAECHWRNLQADSSSESSSLFSCSDASSCSTSSTKDSQAEDISDYCLE